MPIKQNKMFVFIKRDGDWYALEKSKITRQIYAECFDSSGQRIGHDVAGTVLEIQSDIAAHAITKYARQESISNKRFKIGDQISATPEISPYYDDQLFFFAYGLDGVDRFEEGCMTYSYKGWSNWHTLFFDFDTQGPVEEIEHDVKLIRAMRAAIGAHKQWAKKTNYGFSWTGKRFRVSTSLMADAWWDFMIEEI